MSKRLVLVTLFFLIATIIFTYPLVFKVNNSIPGSHSTDEPYAVLWDFWWIKYAFLHQLPDAFYSTLAVPFGVDSGKTTLYPAWKFIYKWLSISTSPIISYNIQVILSFIFSGLTMFALVFYLTKKTAASLFAGAIYSFCPYHFARAWQHLGLAQIQWMPLYILSLLRLKDHVTYRNAFLSILSFYLVVSFEFHYAYFMYIVTILFALYCVLYYRVKIERYIRLLKFIFLIIIISIFFILPTSAVIGIKQIFFARKNISPSAWSAVRPFEDLFLQSARPLSYFLPATDHPVFGKFTEQFVGSSLYGVSFTEHALYLGWVPLALAFIVILKYRKGRRANKQATGASLDFNQGFFIFLAITAWLFSQPPWWNILGFKLYMPTFFLYKIIPIIRAYCRMGIVVMLAVSVLAGFGLKFILLKCRTRFLKIAITCLLSGLVLFEFWNWPPYKVIDVSVFPTAYTWLKSQPGDFSIAEYPLDTNGINEMYKFYQTKHEKKIINGAIPGTYPNKIAKTITRLSEVHTVGVLGWMKVKYVLVHKDDYLSSELMDDREELNRISSNSGLKFVKSFPPEDCLRQDIMCVRKTGQIDVYEVISPAVKPE